MIVGRRDYEERKAARIERLRARAAKLGAVSEQRLGTANRIASAIPFGQPILVGHHSERRHRRDAERIHDNMRKGIDAQKAAESCERRADAAEDNRAISSDDPEAVVKLKHKLAGLVAAQEKMKQVNACIRKHRKGGQDAMRAAVMAECGLPEKMARQITEPDFMKRIGFAPYQLSNNNAEISRVKARISHLEARAAVPETELEFGDIKVVLADNRVQIHFPGKPSDALRTELKQNGFKWAPSVGAWQRMPSQWAWDVAKRIAARAAADAA